MATYVIYDMSTLRVMGIYSAESAQSEGVASEGRTLRHARVPVGVDIAFSHPEQVEGEWVAVTNPDAPPPTPVPSPDMVAITEGLVKNAIDFGWQVLVQFAAENVRMGVTQAGKTKHIRETLQSVILCLLSGSLYDAIAEAKAVPDEAKDPVFLTNARLLAFVNKIEAHLGLAASTSL